VVLEELVGEEEVDGHGETDVLNVKDGTLRPSNYIF